MIPGAPRHWLGAAAMAWAALAACAETERATARLDGPADVAILPAGGLYEVPVALVPNLRNGRVSKLDLKRGNRLVEDGPAPWMPGPDLAFGSARALSQIALVEPGDAVDVWVADEVADVLLRQPWVLGRGDGGVPEWNEPALGAVRWLTADGADLPAASAPVLDALRIGHGRGASETWTGTWDGRSLELRGSASGLQDARALPGTPYVSDRGELRFTLSLRGAELPAGTRVEIGTDAAVEEAASGGYVTDLQAIPSGEWVLASVIPDAGPGWVSIWDTGAFVELDRVVLPLGAAPERLDLGAQDGVVWVADSFELPGGTGRIFRLDFVPGDLDSVAATEIAVPEPAIDVAEGRDPVAPRAFVAAAYTDAVWSLDPLSGDLLDVNLATDDLDPTHVRSLVSGLAATNRPVETAQLDDNGTRKPAYGVMATTFAGEMYWIDAATGCQVFASPAGAFLSVSPSTAATSTFADTGFESNPVLVQDASGERVVVGSPCGGVTRSESWTVRYDEVSQSYEVEGSLSGVQAGRAFEGVRYSSDGGEISFLILPGTLATSHGDTWNFPMDDGVAPIPLQELPGDPVVFTELYDDRSGPWYLVREREIAVVPNVGNDVVLWVDIAGQGTGGIRAFQ